MAELWIPVTIFTYLVALWARRHLSSPLLQPTLLSIAALAIVLVATHVPYPRYAHSTSLISALLGPAVVALAVPLHRERELLRQHGRVLLLGALTGIGSAIALGWTAARLFNLTHAWALALTSRTVTSSVSIQLAGQLHGTASLSATLSILTGLIGATVGPRWLDLVRVNDPLARGLAHGISSHGLGTARMLEEHPASGAAATVGMALGALLAAITIPLIWT